MKNITFLILAVILAGIAVICNMPARYGDSKEVKVADFPMVMGEWQGKDLPIEERDYDILETRNLFVRNYKNLRTGDVVNLYIIYSNDNRKALHPPEICYTGGGSTIIEKSIIQLSETIKANKFVIETKEGSQMITYWFKSTDVHTPSYLRQQLKMTTDNMLRRPTSNAMIRMSIIVKDGKDDDALKVIKKFCSIIEPLLAKYVP